MKKLIFLLSLALLPLLSSAQTYTPLNLDTSCYWIQDYFYYTGFTPSPTMVHGEVIQYVAGDTTVMGNKYYKIQGYSTTTKQYGSIYYINTEYHRYNCYSPLIYIRDDSVNKRILAIFSFAPFSEFTLLDFNLNVGDSMNHCFPSSNVNIDSISSINYNGVFRRTLFGSKIPSVHQGYNRIEGIGANLNFPDIRCGEWDVPVFKLNAFIKGGNIQYRNPIFPIDSCYRKPRANPICWPLSVVDQAREGANVFYSQNKLRLTNISSPTSVKLFSMTGAVLFEKKRIASDYLKDFSGLPAGIYILSVQSTKWVENKKVLIQ